MATATDGIFQHAVPWRREIAWELVLVEGLVIIGTGLFLAFQPDAARSTIRGLVGAFLIFNSVLGIFAGLRQSPRNQAMAPYRLLRGGIGLFVGVIVVLQPVFDYIDANAARTILALGLTMWGLIGLYAAFATHGEGGFRWTNIFLSVLSLAFAIMLFWTGSGDNPLIGPIGILAVIVGAILVAYAFVLRRGGRAPEGQQSPDAVLS